MTDHDVPYSQKQTAENAEKRKEESPSMALFPKDYFVFISVVLSCQVDGVLVCTVCVCSVAKSCLTLL